LVELALTMPVLFLMVIGIAEVGFLANNYLIALDALREGGRYAVQLNPMNWHTSLTDPAGDNETRNQQRADCETTATLPSFGALFHVNLEARDGATSPAGDGGFNPHPFGVPGYFEGAESGTLGFYDAVMCQVVAALDPLFFDYRYDDIVISVISFANRCEQWDGTAAGAAACYADPANYRQPQGNRHLTITGRYPLMNRKCADDNRDPFAVPGASNPVPVPGANKSDVRGYIVMGNMKPPNTACIGSWFYLNDSHGFAPYASPEPYNIDYLLNSLPSSQLQLNAPGGALVLVELYWNHKQLFNFPPFSFFNDTTSQGVRLHLWQAFPIVSAEPTPTSGS